MKKCWSVRFLLSCDLFYRYYHAFFQLLLLVVAAVYCLYSIIYAYWVAIVLHLQMILWYPKLYRLLLFGSFVSKFVICLLSGFDFVHEVVVFVIESSSSP